MAFSKTQQTRLGKMRRCRICVDQRRDSTEDKAVAAATVVANRVQWRTDKAWVQGILDDTFPDAQNTTYDVMRDALGAHWDAMRDKGVG